MDIQQCTDATIENYIRTVHTMLKRLELHFLKHYISVSICFSIYFFSLRNIPFRKQTQNRRKILGR